MSLYDSNGDGVPIPGAITNKILNLSEFFIHYVDKCTHDWTAHNEFDLETFMLTGTGPLTPPMTEFRQPLQVQSHLEVPRILVQLGHIQRT